MSSNIPQQTGASARAMSIAGIVLGTAAIIFAPIILGPIGAILGFLAQKRGDKPLGLYVAPDASPPPLPVR